MPRGAGEGIPSKLPAKQFRRGWARQDLPGGSRLSLWQSRHALHAGRTQRPSPPRCGQVQARSGRPPLRDLLPHASVSAPILRRRTNAINLELNGACSTKAHPLSPVPPLRITDITTTFCLAIGDANARTNERTRTRTRWHKRSHGLGLMFYIQRPPRYDGHESHVQSFGEREWKPRPRASPGWRRRRGRGSRGCAR